MPDDPLAYFITFRCYGTWLHGDERGSTGWSAEGYVKRFNADAVVEEASRERLRFPPLTFTERQRSAVRAAVEEASGFRHWHLAAMNVRTNHVHVVLAAPQHKPEQVMTTLKAYATRRLRLEGLIGPNRPVWSRHGSTRYLWSERQVTDTCAYVVYGQDDQHSPYDDA